MSDLNTTSNVNAGDVPAHFGQDVNGTLNFHGSQMNGFSNAILATVTNAFRIHQRDGMAVLVTPHPVSYYHTLRDLTIKMLGMQKTHYIVPSKNTVGLCGRDASTTFNAYYQQGGPSQQLIDAGDWIDMWELYSEAFRDDRYHAVHQKDLIFLKVAVRCEAYVPILTLHIMIINGGVPDVDRAISQYDALKMITKTGRDAIYVYYELENHPDIGGEHCGRHFEVLLPTAAGLKQLLKAETKGEQDKQSVYAKAAAKRQGEEIAKCKAEANLDKQRKMAQ